MMYIGLATGAEISCFLISIIRFQLHPLLRLHEVIDWVEQICKGNDIIDLAIKGLTKYYAIMLSYIRSLCQLLLLLLLLLLDLHYPIRLQQPRMI